MIIVAACLRVFWIQLCTNHCITWILYKKQNNQEQNQNHKKGEVAIILLSHTKSPLEWLGIKHKLVNQTTM